VRLRMPSKQHGGFSGVPADRAPDRPGAGRIRLGERLRRRRVLGRQREQPGHLAPDPGPARQQGNGRGSRGSDAGAAGIDNSKLRFCRFGICVNRWLGHAIGNAVRPLARGGIGGLAARCRVTLKTVQCVGSGRSCDQKRPRFGSIFAAASISSAAARIPPAVSATVALSAGSSGYSSSLRRRRRAP
jgi:hypothetical protein